MKTQLTLLTLIALSAALFSGCKKEIFIADEGQGSASHSNGFPANYDIIFNQNKVNRLEIIFTAQEWSDMQQDLSNYQRQGGGPGQFPDGTPSYFECELHFNDLVWDHVGIRYKGNSSLRARSNKLPLRLHFDKWEEDYPEVMDQRFYGFKELSLSSNYNDASLMREKSAADLFRNFGVPAVQSAFVEIYIDQGTGTFQYFGVYTLLEIVDDTFLKSWFGSKTGNCYKPDGTGAKFSTSGFDLGDFEAKTNELTNTKLDIQELYNVLHSSLRTTDEAQWRSDLEEVFDVDGFLKYLAVNNTIQNWDTYGKMTHNYYLYHDPADDLIKWISWDNNEAFQNGNQGGALSFGMTEVGTDWPLINFLISNSTYEEQYKAHIKSFIETSFASSRMGSIYTTQQTLLTNSAASEENGYSYINGIGGFNSAVSTLQSHNASRISAAQNYIK